MTHNGMRAYVPYSNGTLFSVIDAGNTVTATT
jgi:hypothetical protein